MYVFTLYCLLKIGAINCPIKEIRYLLTYLLKTYADYRAHPGKKLKLASQNEITQWAPDLVYKIH